jgi:hypothetical protein
VPQPLAPVLVDRQAEPADMGWHPRPAGNGRLGVWRVKEPPPPSIARRFHRQWVIARGTVHPAQLTLTTEAAGASAQVAHRAFGLN